MEELKQLENYLNLANKRGAFELAESVKVVNAVINLSKILQEKDREIADFKEKIRREETAKKEPKLDEKKKSSPADLLNLEKTK